VRELLDWGASLDGGPIKGSELPPEFAFTGTPEMLRLLLGAGMRIARPEGDLLGAAAAAGNIELLRGLLALGISPDAPDRKGCRALYRASENQGESRRVVFQALLAARADANSYCDHETVLHLVAAYPNYRNPHGDVEILRLLLRAGADPNRRRRTPEKEYALTPLESVVESTHGNEDNAKLLIAHGAKLTDRLLFIASDITGGRRDGAAWIDFFADRGANVNAEDRRWGTPLLTAIRWGRLEAAAALLKRGANPRASMSGGYTALHLLPHDDRTAVPAIKLLEPFKLDVNAKAKDGLTPLLALTHAHAQPLTIAALLQAGADVHARDANGKNIVHHVCTNAAVSETQPHTLEALQIAASSGAAIDAADARGNTPLMSAVRWKQIRLVSALLALGADPNARNKNGLTPLHFAAFVTHPAITKLLLDNGARKDVTSTIGERPYDIVAFGLSGSSAISLTLVKPGALEGRSFNVEAPRTSSVDDMDRRETLRLLSADDVAPLAQSPYGAKPDVKELAYRFFAW
jgi:ankyrin repeat protein